jgi:predicted lipoprotein with Yx(FWY)xxD motif
LKEQFMNRLSKVLLASTLALATFGGLSVTQTASAQTTPTTTTAAPPKIKIGMADSSLGRIMVDGSGITRYMFAPDRYNVSNCEGRCLTAWPPLKLRAGQTLEDVELSGGLRRLKLSVALVEDGSRQVTYNGWPLYYWFRDTKPGDVLGQWVNDIWWVLNEDGVPNTGRVPAPQRS